MSHRIAISALLFALTACSQSPQAPAARSGAPLDAVRVALPKAAAEPVVRAKDAQPAWSGNGRSASLAWPGEVAELTVACESGRLVITRHAFADPGGQALFALIGNGTILRLPVDAAASPGAMILEWRGSLDGADEKAKVFLGERFEATLPGAGKLEVPGDAALKDVVQGCAPDSHAPAQAGASGISANVL